MICSKTQTDRKKAVRIDSAPLKLIIHEYGSFSRNCSPFTLSIALPVREIALLFSAKLLTRLFDNNIEHAKDTKITQTTIP
ncbi:hypothetical protein C8R14_11433 [Nitrosomonas eutropha]|uniref:Uncharacterized protein n=1 Tax=Nitrosomonas eutropha TaxID=916 RepID=A0ABX5M7E1_9PROT|nr:hypothetical protein C8R14_11433 [Nitrosomonas eutropha]SEI41032.1 hypothetical protein SAMN05216318_10234 [Nitrosomonas eutropha]